MPSIRGKITDTNGQPVVRTCRAYRRDTGELMGSGVSDADTGQYAIATAHSGEHTVVLFDDDIGTLEADQAIRVFPV